MGNEFWNITMTILLHIYIMLTSISILNVSNLLNGRYKIL